VYNGPGSVEPAVTIARDLIAAAQAAPPRRRRSIVPQSAEADCPVVEISTTDGWKPVEL